MTDTVLLPDTDGLAVRFEAEVNTDSEKLEERDFDTAELPVD